MQNTDDLKGKITELEKYIKRLEEDLIHDSLTGLKTRRFFEEETGTYLEAIENLKTSTRKEWFGFKNLSVLFFDIDHFKKINDTYGHEVGDEVLIEVSKTIQSALREGDTAARWGGEEIVTSLLGANEEDAAKKAEEIRQKIEHLNFPNISDLKVTVSVGVATANSGMDCKEIIVCADKALYCAKNTGRNRVAKFSEIKT